jgi:hypothetical protein
MKSGILRIGLLIVVCFLINRAHGQVYDNDESAKEKHFIYEVKQIDEFFERFNNDSSSFIRGVYKSYRIKYRIDRSRLIKSLFNYETKSWDTSAINNFVFSVTDKRNPGNLDFYGDDWFAELECKFQYNTSTFVVPLILKIVTTSNKGAKWVIEGVGAIPVKNRITVAEMPSSQDITKCISPSSHAANFVSLKKAFADKENLPNCFGDLFLNKPNALEFYNAVLNNQIEFLYVKHVKYHFLLKEKWIFTVEYFPREELNSGWLINDLKEVSADEMENYKRKFLGYN